MLTEMMWSHLQNHLCSKSKVIGLRLVEESLSTRGLSMRILLFFFFFKYDGFPVFINGDLNYLDTIFCFCVFFFLVFFYCVEKLILKTNSEISNFSKPWLNGVDTCKDLCLTKIRK